MRNKDLENKIIEYENIIFKLKGEITYLSSKIFDVEIENNYLKQRNERLINKINKINNKNKNRKFYDIDKINNCKLDRLNIIITDKNK